MRTRAVRAVDVYREEIIKRDMALQKKFNPVSSQYWKEVKEGFANLAPEQRSAYQTRAANTVGEALLGQSAKCARGEGKAAAAGAAHCAAVQDGDAARVPALGAAPAEAAGWAPGPAPGPAAGPIIAADRQAKARALPLALHYGHADRPAA